MPVTKEFYRFPLPDFQRGDIVAVNPEHTLLVTLCHIVYAATRARAGVDVGAVQLWHTQEGSYVAIESDAPPTVMPGEAVDRWVKDRGGGDPVPMVLIILPPTEQTS